MKIGDLSKYGILTVLLAQTIAVQAFAAPTLIDDTCIPIYLNDDGSHSIQFVDGTIAEVDRATGRVYLETQGPVGGEKVSQSLVVPSSDPKFVNIQDLFATVFIDPVTNKVDYNVFINHEVGYDSLSGKIFAAFRATDGSGEAIQLELNDKRGVKCTRDGNVVDHFLLPATAFSVRVDQSILDLDAVITGKEDQIAELSLNLALCTEENALLEERILELSNENDQLRSDLNSCLTREGSLLDENAILKEKISSLEAIIKSQSEQLGKYSTTNLKGAVKRIRYALGTLRKAGLLPKNKITKNTNAIKKIQSVLKDGAAITVKQ